MATISKDTQHSLPSLHDAAEYAGKEIRVKLENMVMSAKEERKYLLFEPKDHEDIFGTVMKGFAQDFSTRHPVGRLSWGKGFIIIQPTTIDERTFGQIAGDPWLLALGTSAGNPGVSLSLHGKLDLKSNDVYLGYAVVV